MQNTEPKAHLFKFDGDFQALIDIFYKKIKPIEGIFKFKMVNWSNFPKDTEQAKKMSIQWSKSFRQNKLYDDFTVGIYFHLKKKTIRFQLKKSKLFIIDLEGNVEDYILDYRFEKSNNIFLFRCDKVSYFDSIDFEKSKEIGKRLSADLETKYIHSKFIVFLNYYDKNIKISLK